MAQGCKRVGYMYREDPDRQGDSGWRVFSGEETQGYADDSSNFAMYNASTIVNLDPSIAPFLADPAPVTYERKLNGEFVKDEL